MADDGIHGWELWQSDGTLEGTVLVEDFWPGGNSSLSRAMADVSGTLFFAANDGIHGQELWKVIPTEPRSEGRLANKRRGRFSRQCKWGSRPLQGFTAAAPAVRADGKFFSAGVKGFGAFSR